MPETSSPQVLVLCPTRELASQVADEIRRLTKYVHGIRILAIYGGQNIENQITALKKKPQIIIGTPGRVMDHMRRRTLRFGDLKMLVLDEADEMLNMGFREDIDTILAEIPEEKQMLLFSATMAPEIMKLTEKYQRDPVYVRIARKELTTDLHAAALYRSQRIFKDRTPLPSDRCGRRHTGARILQYEAPGGSGDIPAAGPGLCCGCPSRRYEAQHERERVMNKFRKGITQILVATDVAARGIDVNGVQAVFNYDIPEDPEQYVHRIGRTGRAGHTGKAYSFVFGREMYKLKEIMRYTKSDIERMRPPAIRDVEAARIGAADEKDGRNDAFRCRKPVSRRDQQDRRQNGAADHRLRG